MYYLNAVELDTSPRKELADKIPEINKATEMSRFESSFLCGLLNMERPRKIVEVGVANGGTTAIILQSLHNLGHEFHMYSVDKSEQAYRHKSEPTGYLAAKVAGAEHRFFLGGVLPDFLDEIGDGIDFLILDTVHELPGEALDFLCAFPYLTKNALVCLHDVSLNHSAFAAQRQIATNVLFNSVAADKYINTPTDNSSYPNIAAFRVTEDTETYITNCIGALTQTWNYLPERKDMESYARKIEGSYQDEAIWLFKEAVALNERSLLNIPWTERAKMAGKLLLGDNSAFKVAQFLRFLGLMKKN